MFRALHCSLIPGLISLVCIAQSSAGPQTTAQTPPSAGSGVASAQPSASPDQAAGTSSSSAASNAAPAPGILGEATALYRKGDFDGALAKYQAFLQQEPKSPDAWAGIIRVYLKQKKVDQSAHAAEQALALNDAPRIRVAYGEVLFRQGKIDLAEKEWVAVINSGYPEARAYLGLARVYRAAAMYKSAEKMIHKAHTIDPADRDIQERWIATLSRSERIKYLEESLAGENN
jgi:tetratricopeptide (TPR) repeat protein